MRLSDFDYNLPKNLIAQKPIKPRDHSRLLLISKKTGKVGHKHFYDILDYLKAGDVLVLNNSKVMPARLIGKKETGGKIEVFLLNKIKNNLWQCLLGGKRRRPGLEIKFGRELRCRIVKDNKDGTWEIKFNKSGKEFMKVVGKIGLTPLPPYIKRNIGRRADNEDYQTVYADDKKIGSVAAPTAGFHFTPALLKKLRKKGVLLKYVTLHVGLGTFAPVKVDNIKKHKMHAEWVEADKKTITDICLAKSEGRKIIAVGTTSARTLETIFSKIRNPKSLSCRRAGEIRNYSGWTDIFIYPGYKFKAVDALITNFHLPKSTLLMLVSAFAGKKNIDKAYGQAIKKKYRFYSYGDAMLIY
ncbi:MAG: tRNA preQ1(34) S-adenosylmethionine ribosyltransferase-isomerase QueA [Patescibacteria group bacterium]|nr:tRNA preQ1(34) S-adenosylmethionine ribosyltransferase-isomerase QueA [Patescibacteria group bacterium]MDD5294840.1 tRNA preQ1(34) S-adenosylmethionine ribosyltransferase-isomerase QueA [Patescibacteria group bacterium]MDD5554488.1 tRNA preQ1(34) S-adenosylmethionine ribosyltransferase-isomerase QueA [Patescibacteria group bacterium]